MRKRNTEHKSDELPTLTEAFKGFGKYAINVGLIGSNIAGAITVRGFDSFKSSEQYGVSQLTSKEAKDLGKKKGHAFVDGLAEFAEEWSPFGEAAPKPAKKVQQYLLEHKK